MLRSGGRGTPTAAGVGSVPLTVAAGRATGQTAAKANLLSYTVGAADASFEVVANVLVTVATSHSFQVSVTFTDEGNTSRTYFLCFTITSGAPPGSTISNTNGALPYVGMSSLLRAKAGTTITVQTSGTFTTVTYNVEAWLRQIG